MIPKNLTGSKVQSRMMTWKSDVVQFVVRFVIGGLLVASIPVISKRSSPEFAGIVSLLPVVTLSSFTFLWIQSGYPAVSRAALASAIAVPAVLFYLLVLWLCLRCALAFPIAMLIAMIAWLVAATIADQVVKKVM